MLPISAGRKPCPASSCEGEGALRSSFNRVAGGGAMKLPKKPRNCAVSRGNTTRATNGTVASRPKVAERNAPLTMRRLPP